MCRHGHRFHLKCTSNTFLLVVFNFNQKSKISDEFGCVYLQRSCTCLQISIQFLYSDRYRMCFDANYLTFAVLHI